MNSIPNSVIECCGSTNEELKKLAEAGAPHGTWLSSQIQTAGRGRQGRSWASAKGNLFLSVLLQPSRAEILSWIPLSVAVACARQFEKQKLAIKWPNDLLIGGEKTGGILCEATRAYVIAGVGLNCETAPPGLDVATQCLGVSAEEVRRPLIETILDTFSELEERGFDSIAESYSRYSVLRPGTPITWSNDSRNAKNERGMVQGLGQAGELLVLEEATGKAKRLFAEDVHLA